MTQLVIGKTYKQQLFERKTVVLLAITVNPYFSGEWGLCVDLATGQNIFIAKETLEKYYDEVEVK